MSVVKRLLRREDGKIKVKVEVHVIRSDMIIKRSSHGFPWILHRGKMSEQGTGERNR